ncbi:MAG TPA: 6-hydroxymethylpterin diphosphokinase MptE-like protein [Anaerolineaceae bacterium]|nr:6-hydroxymethylpterin diphosphokinase MptE-like protein [Anaerolineaceae bacterium]
MSEFKNTLKRHIPDPLVSAAKESWDALGRLGEWPAAQFHPWRLDTVHRLKALKDKHRGERCFILGNGPSLRKTDLSCLRNEYTIGMNRIYLIFPEIGFKTSYYLAVNDLVVEQCAADIQTMDIPRFVSWRGRRWLKPADDLYFLYTTYTGPKFGANACGRLWEGATVTYAALQLAFYLGFQKVILIGVDHNFVTHGKPNTTVVSQGDDPNHFDPGYFGKGFRWQLPDLVTSEKSYGMARRAYEEAGRQVLDATIGGKLRVFPRVKYENFFHK